MGIASAASWGAQLGQGRHLSIEVPGVDLQTVAAVLRTSAKDQPARGEVWAEVSGKRIRAGLDEPRSFLRAAPVFRGTLKEGRASVIIAGQVQWRVQVFTVFIPLVLLGIFGIFAGAYAFALIDTLGRPAWWTPVLLLVLLGAPSLPALLWARSVPRRWWPADVERLDRGLRSSLAHEVGSRRIEPWILSRHGWT